MIVISNKLDSDICLFVYSCLLFLSILNISNFNLSYPYFYIHFFYNAFIAIAFIVNIFFILTKHSLRESFIPLILLFVFLMLLFLKIRIAPILSILVCLMYCNSDFINIKYFVKCTLGITILTFSIIVSLNLLGKIPSIASNLPGVNKGYTLGFTHPDCAGVMALSIISSLFIVTDYFMIHFKKHYKTILSITIIISLIFTVIFYPLTQCKELLFFEIIVFIFMLFYKFRKYIYIFILPISIVAPIITIYLDYHYNPLNKFYYIINQMLSGRLFMQQSVLHYYPAKLFRYVSDVPNLSSLEIEKSTTILIDNSYISILESVGIIGIIISGLILCKILFNSIRSKDYIICILIMGIIICSSVQSTVFSIYLDGPLLYSGILYSHKLHLKK